MKTIASAANPRFSDWLKLAAQPRAVRARGRTLAEGLHLAQSARDSGASIAAVLVRRGAKAADLDAFIGTIAHRQIPTFELTPALFDRLSPVQAGVGLMLELVVPQTGLPPQLAQDAIYLDGVQDPGNAGALLRVAAAAGVRWVLSAAGTAALWAPRTLRAAQGAHFALSIVEGVDPATAAALLRGTWIAAAAHDAESLWRAELPSAPIGWVFGAEGMGISAPMLAQCRKRLQIPLAAGVESLNVAAAAAVCLFERRRRLDDSQ